MSIDIGLIGAYSMAIINAIIHYPNEIVYFLKDLFNFYYNRDKEIFTR